jgi:hypothetical protein
LTVAHLDTEFHSCRTWARPSCLINLIGMPHDSANRLLAQIINPLGQWMKLAYRTSRMWIID